MYYDQKESGKRIAKLRKDKGLTQEQLAESLNISTDYVGKMENGRYGGSVDLLVEISEFFEVTLDYLVLGKEMSDGTAIKVAVKKALLFVIEFLTRFVNEL